MRRKRFLVYDIARGEVVHEFDCLERSLVPAGFLDGFYKMRPWSGTFGFDDENATSSTEEELARMSSHEFPPEELDDRIVLRGKFFGGGWRLNKHAHCESDANRTWMLLDSFDDVVVSTEKIRSVFFDCLQRGDYDKYFRDDDGKKKRTRHMDFAVRSTKGETVVLFSESFWSFHRLRKLSRNFVFRSDPVPGTGGRMRGTYKGFRSFSNIAEKRLEDVREPLDDFLESAEEGACDSPYLFERLEVRCAGVGSRRRWLPDSWDDISRHVQHSWKRHGRRKRQWSGRSGGRVYVDGMSARSGVFVVSKNPVVEIDRDEEWVAISR